MHEHLTHFLSQTGQWGYLVIFICVTLECSSVFFLPGETLVVLGGFFASRGQLDLGSLIVVVAVAAILGYCLGFELGRQFGRSRIIHFGRSVGLADRHFERVEAFFARYGGAAVFLGRFTWFMRAFVSLAAGFSAMPYRVFFVCNVAGGFFWAVAFTLLGYFVGESWAVVEGVVGRAFLVVIVGFIAVGAFIWSRRQR